MDLRPKEPSSLRERAGFFCTERGGTKAKHFLVPVSLRKGGVNVFFLQRSQVGLVRRFPGS